MPAIKSKTDGNGLVREILSNGGSYTVRLRTKGDDYTPYTVLASRDVPTEEAGIAIWNTLQPDQPEAVVEDEVVVEEKKKFWQKKTKTPKPEPESEPEPAVESESTEDVPIESDKETTSEER